VKPAQPGAGALEVVALTRHRSGKKERSSERSEAVGELVRLLREEAKVL